MKQIVIVISFALAFALPAASVRGETGTSQFFTNGVVTDWGRANLYVGNTGPNNYLQISNGSGLTNAGFCYIGNSSNANQNTLLVSDTNSVFKGTLFATGLYIGNSGSDNQFVVSNGAVATIGPGYMGRQVGADHNAALISGSGSIWSNDIIYVGWSGAGTSVTIQHQGRMVTQFGFIVLGYQPSSSNNIVTISDTGSVWTTGSSPSIGYYGAGNQMVITNGGLMTVRSVDSSWLGYYSNANQNAVLVTGNGSEWDAGVAINLGNYGASNRVDVLAGALVQAQNVILGINPSSTDNRFTVDQSTLAVSNTFHNGTLEVRRGTFNFNSGTVTTEALVLTNATQGVFQFSGGWLATSASTVTAGSVFTVGDGIDAATYHLLGGVHTFNDGLRVRHNATLSGCGTISGAVVVDAGGAIVADCGGTLTFGGSVTNNGTMRAIDGSVLESYGTVVNNGVIDIINGGATQFHRGVLNNGAILDASSVRVSNTAISGNDITIQITSATNHTYQLQASPSLAPTNWVNTGASQAGTAGVLTFTEHGGETNGPSRFYRIAVTAP